MVYCTKCGAKNVDDAVVCVQCGESLAAPRRAFSYRRERDACFGGAWGGAGWVIFFGLVLVLGGLTYYLSLVTGVKFEFWPIVLVLLGVMIIVGVLTSRRR